MVNSTSRLSVERVSIPDLPTARSYYAKVFGADFDSDSDSTQMTIGGRRYLLEPKTQCAGETHFAIVQDADVSVARVATQGGEIVSPVGRTDTGERFGCVRDAFGHLWEVKSGGRS